MRTIAKQQQPRGCIRDSEYYYCRRTLPPIAPGQSTGNSIFLSADLSGASGFLYRTKDQGYGRGGTPDFTGVLEPVARVALYPTDENGLGSCFGAA